MDRREFLETYGFEPPVDGLRPVRPAIYQDPADKSDSSWGWVLIGELAYILHTTPLDIVLRYGPLTGLVHGIVLYKKAGEGMRIGGIRMADAVINDNREEWTRNQMPSELHPRMMIAAGWSQQILTCWKKGIHNVREVPHGETCAEGTIFCRKNGMVSGLPKVDLVGREHCGKLYAGPALKE